MFVLPKHLQLFFEESNYSQEEVEVPAVEETCTTKPVDECKEEEVIVIVIVIAIVIVIVIVIAIVIVIVFLMDHIVKDILKHSQVKAEEEREESQCDTVRL